MSQFANNMSFGVEAETVDQDCYYNVREYHHGSAHGQNVWRREDDSSIRCNYEGQSCEHISPIERGASGLRDVITTLQEADDNGCIVNNSCGMHVHVGVPGLMGEELVMVYLYVANYEEGLFAAASDTSRWNNSYCGRIRQDIPLGRILSRVCPQETISHNSFMNSHCAIDTHRVPYMEGQYESLGTIEFRLYQPSLFSKDVCNAVQLSIGIIEKARTSKKRPRRSYAPHHGVDCRRRDNWYVKEAERMYARLGWIPGTFAKKPCGQLDGSMYSLRQLADYGMERSARFQLNAESCGII